MKRLKEMQGRRQTALNRTPTERESISTPSGQKLFRLGSRHFALRLAKWPIFSTRLMNIGTSEEDFEKGNS